MSCQIGWVKLFTRSQRDSADTAAGRGIAVVLTLFVLVIIGALVAGGFLVGYRQTRAVAAGVQGDAALYAAEAGLSAAFALLDSAALDSVPPGGRWQMTEGSLISGDAYSVQLTRWDAGQDSGARYYLLASTGRAAGPHGGRRSVGAMIRQLPARDPCCAAAVEARGMVSLDWGAVASGLDVEPAIWSAQPELCHEVVPSDRAGVITDAPHLLQATDAVVEGNPPLGTATAPSEYGEVTRWLAELALQADLRYPGDTVLTGLGPTTWANGECARSSPTNWGAPTLPDHACFSYFPVIHASGDLIIAGPGSGQGVLVVEGDLSIGEGFEFYGVVLVGGSVVMGGAGSQVLGGLRVGNEALDTVRVLSGGRVQYSGCVVRRATQGAKVQGPHPLAEFGWFEILE